MIKLLTDATTPFGRKVMVAALERDLPVEETFVLTDEALDRFNPLRQIPALVTDAGAVYYDSDTITLYLDSLCPDSPLVPDPQRFEVLTRMALANGLIEAVLQRIMESRLPDGERSDATMDRLEQRALRAISALEHQADQLGTDQLNAADIAAGCALEYADFRLYESWRDAAPALTSWLATMAKRASFVATRPTRSTPASPG